MCCCWGKGQVLLCNSDCQGWGDALPCWCATGRVREACFWAGDWLGLSREARALLGNSEQFGRCLGAGRGTQKRKAGVDQREEGGQGQSTWDGGGSLYSIKGPSLLVQLQESGSCSFLVLLLVWLWSWAQAAGRKWMMQKKRLWSWKE